ncbi:hypothetical protein D9758_017145 [Tetrapyrgos nigripes]|uniref:Ras GEF n=1 Tax=Tetrapyrgos nigripes TaxID=182062 RepID=A0A8H5BV76_9AGAR|nr:hypothetical protein D9758_017145 [Tetrapyrgos nigripes]
MSQDPSDSSHSQTLPVSSSPPVLPSIPPISSTGLDFSSPDTFSASLPPISTSTSSPSSPDPSHHVLLPIPAPSNNKSQASFTYPDASEDNSLSDPLPPEIANADISIAPDGSFVETSVGPAARELKKRYDQHYGVGPSVRSPYAITAFTNQHGKTMYRVGHRDQSAPGASAADAEDVAVSKSKSPSTSPQQHKRQSRISFNNLLRNGSSSSTSNASQPRKLKKPRSNPDLTSNSDVRPSRHHHGNSTGGRMHSLSVTAADMPRASYNVPVHHGDAFGDVMDWSSPSSDNFSTHSLFLSVDEPSSSTRRHGFPSVIQHPFGSGVSFESPAAKANPYLPIPRPLREMQSFESGLTARQNEPEETLLDRLEALHDLTRPPSAIHLRQSYLMASSGDNRKDGNEVQVGSDKGKGKADVQVEVQEQEQQATRDSMAPAGGEPSHFPLPETAMHSRYSTDIFDVLQAYSGLPLLDKLSDESEETTVIKLSLSSENNAAPRNDPRFVIWGEVYPELDTQSQESLDLSSSRSGTGPSSKTPVGHASGAGFPNKVLVAATIERWIAQLTSDLNYDELLDFFLTYRTYITSMDLAHLLICRFHWALQTRGKAGAGDEVVRRIVRVRTFVAFRYWLLTFFTVDFVPNRDLRLLVASWLNTLIHDPILEKHSDGLSIVKKLKKVAKDCMKAHTRTPPRPKYEKSPTTKQNTGKELLLGEKFAEATRKLKHDDSDSDVDLDFAMEEASSPTTYQQDPANLHLSAIHLGGAAISPSGPNSIALSNLSILQRTDHAPGPGEDTAVPFIQTAATLPIHHNALSRAFVKTIGRLGRWKRVLNNRTNGRAPANPCAGVSAFDLELTVSRDLLTVNGGVESYLRMIERQSPTPSSPTIRLPDGSSESTPVHSVILSNESSATSSNAPTAPASASFPSPPPDLPAISTTEASGSATSAKPSASEESSTVSGDAQVPSVPDGPPPEYSDSEHDSNEIHDPPTTATTVPEVQSLADSHSSEMDRASLASSRRTTSTDSFGEPLSATRGSAAFPGFRSPWQFDVVSIDELDLSDTSSDPGGDDGPALPPGLRRLPRRLPLRRAFEFLDRRDTVSSMGIISRDSVASEASSTSSISVGLGGGNIQQWQMNALVDSLAVEDEPGDVEDALRRLEGQISPQKRQEKASKVDDWINNMRERLAMGNYVDEPPRFLDDSDEEEQGDDLGEGSSGAAENEADRTIPAISVPDDSAEESDGALDMENVSTPVLTQAPPSHLTSPPRSADAKPAVEDAVPLEILQSRLQDMPPLSTRVASITSKFADHDVPRSHRSFILAFKADDLAQHFAMIDRELFMNIKFDELLLDDWAACEEINVLDWAQYLKDRARWKAESRWPEKTSALGSVRGRFNLMVNFTVSEIVLTPPNERPIVFAKFLRIAWKAYQRSSFNTLVAIITGLESEWVTRAMKKNMNKLTLWESRMFSDFRTYISNVDNFKYIRRAVDAIADAKPLNSTTTHSGSVTSGSAPSLDKPIVPSACIPFIGIYLSQLHQYNQLTPLIDPTAPNKAIGFDPVTSNFDPVAHPEVFSTLAPLPQSMHLEPLINVHKQRLIAGVIKSLVAGQHLASRVQFPIDKKLFHKCLRLRGLDTETLRRALLMLPD